MPRGVTTTGTRTTPPKTGSASEQVENSSKLVSSSQKWGLPLADYGGNKQPRLRAYAREPNPRSVLKNLTRPVGIFSCSSSPQWTPRPADERRDERATLHSITSSASDSRLSEILTPSALAVLRLITVSNFVGCSTGRSAGFAPLRIRAV